MSQPEKPGDAETCRTLVLRKATIFEDLGAIRGSSPAAGDQRCRSIVSEVSVVACAMLDGRSYHIFFSFFVPAITAVISFSAVPRTCANPDTALGAGVC